MLIYAHRPGSGSEQAVDLVHLAAGDVQRRVMLTDGFLVGPLKQAVDLPVGVVEQLDLSQSSPRGWNSIGRPRVHTPVGALVSPGL